VRALAVDWSGAQTVAGQRRGIWVAAASDGELRSLTGGLTRDEAVQLVLGAVEAGADIAGFDFSFSVPAWFVHTVGAADGPGLWEVCAADGERWLAACDPPFWGRPGRRRPAYAEERGEWRRTEHDVPAGARHPTGSFQIGGAGAVGTGSVRGMPHLRRLRAAGIPVWPFDDPPADGPAVAEVYPRWWTGPVVKRRAAARAAHLGLLGDRVPPDAAAVATASEDAFDAACTALGLSLGGWRLTPPEALDRIEGRILVPRIA
jgi:hypothetical protein